MYLVVDQGFGAPISSLRYTDQSENVAERRNQTALVGVSSGFLAGSDIWRLLLCYCDYSGYSADIWRLPPSESVDTWRLLLSESADTCCLGHAVCRYVVRSVVFGQQY